MTWGDLAQSGLTWGELTRSSITWRDLARMSLVEIRAAVALVRSPGTSTADLQALAVELRTVLRWLEQQRAAVVAPESPSGLTLSTYRWTVAASIAGIISMVIAVLALVHATTADAQADPPPSVTVVVPQPDPAEIDRRVDERLREIEQQRHARHPDDDSPGTPHQTDR
jgi:hypothetical protein